MSEEAPQEDKTLTVDSLVTGDRPSLYFFGMVGANAIRKDEMAVFMVDALGRVCLMPPSSIQVLERPRVSEEELDTFPEAIALQILVRQGDSDPEIEGYLFRRSSRGVE